MLPSTFSVDMAREAIRQIGIYTQLTRFVVQAPCLATVYYIKRRRIPLIWYYTSFLGLTECHSYTYSTTVTPISSIRIDPTLK